VVVLFFKNGLEKKMRKIFKNNKTLILAYDHGLEHGPKDLNLKNANPEFVFELAEKLKYNAIVTQAGIAEKFHSSYKAPLIVKINGKTCLGSEIISRQNCSVKRAMKLNPIALGYTIYPGSEHESIMFSELSNIIEEAHNHGLPVFVWSYPRNKSGLDDNNTDVIAYAARVALELGADAVKLKYNNDFEGFKWVVKCASRVKVVVAGGFKTSDEDVLRIAQEVLEAGASGLTIGRNIWQNENPERITFALKKIIFENKKSSEVINEFYRQQ
jgi:class I fructose-bisphosphate aldolase